MPVVREFTLPDLGEGLTGAEIVRWLVEVGEVVAVDQAVVEVETAKASVEVPCPYGGVVTARFGAVGEEVPVGAPLVTVAVSAPEGGDGTAGSGNVLVGYGTAGHSAASRRRRVRPEQTLTGPAAAPAATAPPASPARPTRSGPLPVISPLVRRTARELGVDLAAITGSGPDGLILRADVTRAAASAVSRETSSTLSDPSLTWDDEVVPLRGLRRAVAEKLSRSRREIPDATCWVDADATGLLALKDQLAASATAPRIGLLPLLARICTAALARHPELNSRVVTEPDGTPTGIRHQRAVHLGFAAQTERGLVVPVVRDAHLLTTEQLAVEMARLTEAARAGSLSPAELTGGTFTLNNYGVFGVDGSTPIINHPEAAMLGVGRIAAKPWVHGGELAVRQVTQLSFTFDHRVCDGGTAGGFLRFVADCVENPGELLRRL
ncbi:dihydrolipoamide acetyltransferase family protein [Peterkaempfera griseoplana]|uniref:dihydrolipoamide acetyltransferase family protein n=1 Tax=Peterkaempfera griseoplana TaxID=66896 RepID=UPI0006E1A84A|nr:dihydrolipoamide acetyltransferase family protein [Peterkaempfera griseoplana]